MSGGEYTAEEIKKAIEVLARAGMFFEEIKKNIHVNAQPIELSVTVASEVTAKGDLKPSVSIRTELSLEDK